MATLVIPFHYRRVTELSFFPFLFVKTFFAPLGPHFFPQTMGIQVIQATQLKRKEIQDCIPNVLYTLHCYSLPLLHSNFPNGNEVLRHCSESLEEHQPSLSPSEDGMLYRMLARQPDNIMRCFNYLTVS